MQATRPSSTIVRLRTPSGLTLHSGPGTRSKFHRAWKPIGARTRHEAPGLHGFIERRRAVSPDALQKRPKQFAGSEPLNDRLVLVLGCPRSMPSPMPRQNGRVKAAKRP